MLTNKPLNIKIDKVVSESLSKGEKIGKGYELIDSGNEEKLERFGSVILRRPDPQALWKPRYEESVWKNAQGSYIREVTGSVGIGAGAGSWRQSSNMPTNWNMSWGGLEFIIKPTAFKHTGIFPEHALNWQWIREVIAVEFNKEDAGVGQVSGGGTMGAGVVGMAVAGGLSAGESLKKEINVLNLFAYTGGATLAAAQAGAKVVHVDSSKSAVAWARENAKASGLEDKPVRWIVDDAREFVKKELKRGHTYEGIIMDPPAFGHGPEKELWKIEENFIPFVEECMKLLSPNALFFIVNGYSAGYSSITYGNNLEELVQKYGGKIEIGELALEESDFVTGSAGEVGAVRKISKNSEKVEKSAAVLGAGQNVGTENKQRLLPCGIFARWKK